MKERYVFVKCLSEYVDMKKEMMKRALTSLVIILLTSVSGEAIQKSSIDSKSMQQAVEQRARMEQMRKAAQEKKEKAEGEKKAQVEKAVAQQSESEKRAQEIYRLREARIEEETQKWAQRELSAPLAKLIAQAVIERGEYAIDVLLHHLQQNPILVEGQDITQVVAQNVTVRGLSLSQATRLAKVAKRAEILSGKGYNFSVLECNNLAEAIENGRTLEEAIIAQAPLVYCAGMAIQRDVVALMIRQNITFDAALEQVSIDIHYKKLKHANAQRNLGLADNDLFTMAQRVIRKQSATYQAALADVQVPIMFLFESVQNNITPQVAALIFQNDNPGISLNAATEEAKVAFVKMRYAQKNLGLTDEELVILSRAIALDNQTAVQALTQCFALNSQTHRDQQLTDRLAHALASDMTKAAAFAQIKLEIDQDYFSGLNIGLSAQQVQQVAALTGKGHSDDQALAVVLTQTVCKGKDITLEVAKRMIAAKETYTVAVKGQKIEFITNYFQEHTVGLDMPTITLLAQQIEQNDRLSYVDALRPQLVVVNYEANDLRYNIALEMLKKVSFEDAKKKVWVEAATLDISTKHEGIKGLASELALHMYATSMTKAQALEAHIKKLTISLHTQGKAGEVACRVLTKNETIESAWDNVCVKPKILQLTQTYKKLDQEELKYVAKSMLLNGHTVAQALCEYLTSKNLVGTFCKAPLVIVNHMLTSGLSLKEACTNADTDFIRRSLSQKDGWFYSLDGRQFDNLVQNCLSCESIEEAEETFLFSLCPNVPADLWQTFIRLAKFARVPLKQFEAEYFKVTVIPNRLRKEHPNLTDAEILKFIAEKFVLGADFGVALDVTTLKEALQAIYPFSKEGVLGPDVPQMAGQMAVKLIANKNLAIADALVAVRIDDRAEALKAGPFNHLSLDECHEMATIMIQRKNDDAAQVLKLIFQSRKYTEGLELDQIVKAVLVEGMTFQKAEDTYGFRKFMVEDPRLEEGDARQIAGFMRAGHDKKKAYKKCMQEKYGLKDAEAADVCLAQYFKKKDTLMDVAAERAKFVAATAKDLKRRSFYPNEVTEDGVWKIARKTLKHERNVIKGMGLFLLKAYKGAPHLSPQAYELLKEDYFTSLAKAVLAEGNNVSIGDFTAFAWHNFDEFQQRLISQVSLYITGNQYLRRHNDPMADWHQIFGELDVSWPTISAIMMYKFGDDAKSIVGGVGDYTVLKGCLTKAVPVFLQHMQPKDAQAKLHCLGAGNPAACILEESAVTPLCVGFYGALAGYMIETKCTYDSAWRSLQGTLQQKELSIKNGFKYLDARGSNYITEIAEAEVFGQMDRKSKAIYRFLNAELAKLSVQLTMLGKNPTGLDGDEKKHYLEYVADRLSNRSGESLDAVCALFKQEYEGVFQKLRGNIKGKLDFLTEKDCQNLLWDIRIVKSAPEEALGRLLGRKAAAGECHLPAFMLSGRYLGMQYNNAPLPLKMRLAFNKLANSLKFSLDTVPRAYDEAIQAVLLSFFQQSLKNERIQLPKSILQPLAAKLAAIVWNARTDAVEPQLDAIRCEKQAFVKSLLKRKVLTSQEQKYLEAVAKNMLEEGSSVVCALLEARSAELMSGSDRKGLNPDMFEFWSKLVAFKERGIIIDDVATVNVPLTTILTNALKLKQRIEMGEGIIEPNEMDEQGFNPADMSPLELDLATYFLAKKNVDIIEKKLILEGIQPLQESICFSNLQLLDLNQDHFACPNFNLARDIRLVARSKSIQTCGDLLAMDLSTIGTLYRRDNNITPIFVTDNEAKMARESHDAKDKLNREWQAFEGEMGRVSELEWLQPAVLKPWDKHPNNPKFLSSVLASVEAFKLTQQGKTIRINIETLRFDPWYAPTYYDGLPLVTVEAYEDLRNEILKRMKRHMDRKNIAGNEYRGKYWCIGRFFAWGDTRDKHTGINGEPYLSNDIFFKEPAFTGTELTLWRKRVKLICDNLIFKGVPTDEDVFDRCAYLYADEIRNCDNASKDALLKLEQMMPALQKLTFFGKIAHCLNIWKLDKLDFLVTKNLRARRGIETEYGRFMRVLCRRTLSVQTLENDITHHNQLCIYDSQYEVDHRDGLSINPFVVEYLTAYQNEICGLIKQNIEYKPRPDIATHVIYLQDVVEWAKLSPNYCNIPEDDLVGELTVNGDGKELKDVVVHRFLSHAKYIDWEDREK